MCSYAPSWWCYLFTFGHQKVDVLDPAHGPQNIGPYPCKGYFNNQTYNPAGKEFLLHRDCGVPLYHDSRRNGVLACSDSLYFYVSNSTASTGLNTNTNISNDVQRTPWTTCQLNARNTLSFNESVTADALFLYLADAIHYAVGIVEVEIWIPAGPGPRYEAEDGLIGFSSRGGSIGIWRRYHGGRGTGPEFNC